MTSPKESTTAVAETIREIYRNDPRGAEKAIEFQLGQHCEDMTDSEKMSAIAALLEQFETSHRDSGGGHVETENEVLKEVFSLLLGGKIPAGTVSSQETLERLSSSMDTLFTTLNRIIRTINDTLMENAPGEQTIRQVIGSQMAGREGIESLEDYLGRIEKAFLVSHRAFKQAAHTIVRKIIKEIQPEGLASEADKGFKFGPMRKAEYFEMYKAKYVMLEKWFESGHFMNDLLREFENNCQTSI